MALLQGKPLESEQKEKQVEEAKDEPEQASEPTQENKEDA